MVTNKLKSEIIENAQKVLKTEIEAIQAMSSRLNNNFEQAINLMHKCKGRIIVVGMGKSGIIGRKISATLSSTGTPSFFMHPAEGSHGDSGALMKNDVVLAISYSGETAEIIQMLPLIKRKEVSLIAMTGNMESTLAQKSDVVLDVSVEKEACPLNLAPTASTTVTLTLGDSLAVVLLQKRGFTSEDFLTFHPSGSLGKKLLWKVEDLMHTGENLPIVDQNVTFHEALYVITEKRFGMCFVVNENNQALGIITDGDIRRALNKTPDTSKLLAREVMTKNPKTIDRNDLAASGLSLMERYSITSVAILDEDKKPVGLLHIHDLLRAGVA